MLTHGARERIRLESTENCPDLDLPIVGPYRTRAPDHGSSQGY